MELFHIGFITVSLIDLVDIVLVAFIFYKLYQVMRGTVAAQIFIGLLMILALSFAAQALGMRALGWLLGTLHEYMGHRVHCPVPAGAEKVVPLFWQEPLREFLYPYRYKRNGG